MSVAAGFMGGQAAAPLRKPPAWLEDVDDNALTGNADAEADVERAVAADEEALLSAVGDDESEETRQFELAETAKLLTAGGLAGAVSKTATAPLARLTILYQVRGDSGTGLAHPGPSQAAGAAVAGREAGGGAARGAAPTSSRPGAPPGVVRPPGVSPPPPGLAHPPASGGPHGPRPGRLPGGGLPRPPPPPHSAPGFHHLPPPSSVRLALTRLVREEGIRALWRGNGVTMLHRLPYSAANFWVYESTIRLMRERLPSDAPWAPNDVARRFLAGGAAGLAACTLAYPLDLLRTLRAAQMGQAEGQSVSGSLAEIIRTSGPRGLYRGLGATLLQVAPCLAINYTAYESFRAAWVGAAQAFEDERRGERAGDAGWADSRASSSSSSSSSSDDPRGADARGGIPSPPPPPRSPPGSAAPSVVASLACGSMAGLVSSTATFPLDLVRRRLQVGRGPSTYSGVVREILATRGPTGFYSGILPEYYKVVPGVAIAFCVYEALKRGLGVQTNSTGR